MKKNKIIYWVSTALVSLVMMGSGIAQMLHTKAMDELINHVGYPLYFMYIIGVWTIIEVFAILITKYPLIKEWAYVGFFFLMTGALISHLASGDSGIAVFVPLLQTIFIILSWHFRPTNRKLILKN